MKRLNYILVLVIMSMLPIITTNAQSVVTYNLKGEKIIDIHGTQFGVILNDANYTATLCDVENYQIDKRKYAFQKSRKLKRINKQKNLVIPSSVTIGDKVYTVTAIGQNVFAGYQNILSVEIPNTITSIGDYAFYSTSLTNAILPATVVFLGQKVFGQCKNLHSITLPNAKMASTDLYADSKNISIKFAEYITEDVKRQHKKEVEEKREVKYASESDVDVNLPQNTISNEESFAVIIANENYDRVAKVDCAHHDGRTFRMYCEQILGIPQSNIRYIEDATYGQMMEEFNWFSRVAKAYKGDAKFIVYYAGHGVPNENDKTAYLLPVDVSGDNTTAALSLNKLYESLGALNAKNVILFMDACFSGSQRGDGMLMAARGVAIETKAENPLGNMVVFSAAQGDETAYPYPEKGHGLFTYYLLKKLQETKGDVSLGALADYIQDQVGRKSIVVNNKPQTPAVSYSTKMEGSWRNVTLK